MSQLTAVPHQRGKKEMLSADAISLSLTDGCDV
jgi:hypothetical protein